MVVVMLSFGYYTLSHTCPLYRGGLHAGDCNLAPVIHFTATQGGLREEREPFILWIYPSFAGCPVPSLPGWFRSDYVFYPKKLIILWFFFHLLISMQCFAYFLHKMLFFFHDGMYIVHVTFPGHILYITYIWNNWNMKQLILLFWESFNQTEQRQSVPIGFSVVCGSVGEETLRAWKQ